MSVSQALNGLNATDGDLLKSHEGFFVYYIEGHGWTGGLNSLEPGQGYMYYSYAQETKTLVYPTELDAKLLSKQDVLVSGVNIKTINGESLLGEGNIVISGGETDMSNYYTKEEIDNTVGDINTILESIING